MPAAPLSLSPDDAAASDLLDRFRDAVRAWSLSRFDAATGGFRQSDAIGPNVLASTDVVWLRYAVNEPELGAPDRARLVAHLEGAQDPDTGEVRHARGPGGQGHVDAHAFWQAVRALHLLGGRLRRMPRRLRALATPEGLAAWFDAQDWRPGGSGSHHEVLGLVPLVASLRDRALTETLLRKLAEQQDPERGTWPPRGDMNVSRTFAYTAIYAAAGRLPPRPDRIVDAVLAGQHANGLWDVERPHFHTMDAAYLLVRLPPRIGHRVAHAARALETLSAAARAALAAHAAAYASNPHAVLALAHTFGLLQEAFPEAYPSVRPYRFDWDRLDHYACEALRGAGRGGAD